MFNLERFIEAQERDYETALKEIKNGKKQTCWMWYIFPQISGLGKTSTSEKYAIKNIEEAIEYLHNEILRNRLIEISQALLNLEEGDIKTIMGFPDNLKLRSSMTLFKKAEEISNIGCDNTFQKVLDKFFEGEDDPLTLQILNQKKFDKEKGEEEKEEKNNGKEGSSDNNSKKEDEKSESEKSNKSDSDKEKNEKNNENEINNINENNDIKKRKKTLNSLNTVSSIECSDDENEANQQKDSNPINTDDPKITIGDYDNFIGQRRKENLNKEIEDAKDGNCLDKFCQLNCFIF